MRIAYIGSFPFPGSTAATHRVRGVARALELAGHRVTVVPLIGGDSDREAGFQVDTSLSRRADADSWRNAGELLLGGGKAVAWLAERRLDFDIAVIYGTPAALLARCQRAARQGRGTVPPIVLDVVEWYDYASRPGGRFGPFAIEHAASMNLIATRANSAICISRYLAHHFESSGCSVEVVPPLFESIQEPATSFTLNRERLHIGYAGSPGAKDGPGLANLITAAAALPVRLRSRMRIEIVGLNEAEGLALIRRYSTDSDPGLSDTVRWHGRMSSQDAQALVAACDFTYLQRPRARYAMAGFPTKVVESLILGTPVIVNDTSDLASYVADGQNGVLLDQGGLDGASREAVSAVLERIAGPSFKLALDRDEIRARSSEAFHPSRYSRSLDRLVRTAVEG